MNRKKEREQAFFLIFESQFGGDTPDLPELYSESFETVSDFAKRIYSGVTEKADELDGIISAYSNGWKLSRISKVNIAVLRLAIYEMKYCDDIPNSVTINEAVELTKKYAGKEDSSFVNGVLGAVEKEL